MPQPKHEAVSILTAAALMNVSASTMRRLVKSGDMKATRIGRQWRILIVDLRRGTTTSSHTQI